MWVAEIDIDFVFGPEITWFSVSIEVDFVFVWVVEIDFISAWGTQFDVISV